MKLCCSFILFPNFYEVFDLHCCEKESLKICHIHVASLHHFSTIKMPLTRGHLLDFKVFINFQSKVMIAKSRIRMFDVVHVTCKVN